MSEPEILFENKDYIVINKQAGLISEKSAFEAFTAENQVLHYLQKTKPKPFLGIIHRLDRVTSGVLIFAKKKSILVEFNELFAHRKVQKTYLAIVENQPPNDQAILVDFMIKNNLEKKAEIVSKSSKNAVECRLSYRLLDQNDNGYLLEIKPTTGRFHQIRAQLAHVGSPIIGDVKYGAQQAYLPLAICLHAWRLSYRNKNSKEIITYEAPLPKNNMWKN